jgi:hypothetical protein
MFQRDGQRRKENSVRAHTRLWVRLVKAFRLDAETQALQELATRRDQLLEMRVAALREQREQPGIDAVGLRQ